MEAILEFLLTSIHPGAVLSIFDPVSLGIMAAAGGLKHFAVDKPKYDRQKKLAAETARYSPWTGMDPATVRPTQEPDWFSGALGGVQMGATLGQSGMLGKGVQNNMMSDLDKAKLGNLNAQTDYLKGASAPSVGGSRSRSMGQLPDFTKLTMAGGGLPGGPSYGSWGFN